MTTHVDFNDPAIQKMLAKVEALLRLASNNPNENEAAAAASKAQDILAAHQLDMSALDETTGKKHARREDKKLKGGLYKWQRDLWNHVAQLNFCLYWSIRGLRKGSSYEHRILGRTANIVGTKLMAEYLEQAIERITRERYGNDPSQYFAKAGIAYREGMADRICERLHERRREQQIEEERKAREAKATATHPASATSNALVVTVATVTKSEWEANREFEYDLENGPGEYKRMQEMHARYWAEQNRLQAEADAAKAAWIAANPEEHARQEAEKAAREEREAERARKREERNAKRRKNTGPRYHKSDYVRHDDYFEGHERGGDVSLDQQIDNRKDRSIT